LLLDGIILKCNASIQTNRTHAAIYNILKGTKAIQTVMDIHLYHLKNMYGIYPTLQKRDFDYYIENLIDTDHLELVEENKAKITTKGKELLERSENISIFHCFNGHQYIGISEVFMERLLLTIQTFTNKKMKNNHFIPVVDNAEIHSWVKRHYLQYRQELTVILTKLYKELSRLLGNTSDEYARLFVDRLTGYHHYGNSIYQLHTKYSLPIYDVPLLLEGITQQLLSNILQEQSEYPVLNEFIADLHRTNFLTKSARKTYQLHLKGLRADKIASIRNLKVNTIHDHIVEIALYDTDFPYQTYVNQEEAKIILKAIQQTNSYKLKDIKTGVGPNISYFKIRLIMALMRNNH